MKPRLRASTWANYRTYAAAYVVPVLGVAFALQTHGRVIPGMDKDGATTVADLILGGTQKGPGTSVPDPSANKAADNGP